MADQSPVQLIDALGRTSGCMDMLPWRNDDESHNCGKKVEGGMVLSTSAVKSTYWVSEPREFLILLLHKLLWDADLTQRRAPCTLSALRGSLVIPTFEVPGVHAFKYKTGEPHP